MPQSYDTLIAGAGPAGCAAAYDLARAGRRVLLLDRRDFPRPKACACGLTRKTLRALRYSVDPVIERVCHHVVLQEAGPAFATGMRAADKAHELRLRTRAPFCSMAVRERFDKFCLDQTLAQGAGFLRIESIAALRQSTDGIELDVLLRDADGTHTATFCAPVLIGADGSNGQTRRLAAALQSAAPGASSAEPPWYARGFALEATVPYTSLPAELPAGDAPHDLIFDFSPIAGGYGWLFPKGNHINIGVGGFVPLTPAAPSMDGSAMSYESPTRTLLAAYMEAKLGVHLDALTGNPAVRVTGQYLGLGGDAYVPQGRVLLAGDAAGLVDPLTGEGIHSALISGQAAAAAVLEALSAAGKQRQESTLSVAYARHLSPLQQTLAFSHRAARSFYSEPGRGMRAMRNPLLRPLILKTYADGLPHAQLLSRLARTVL